MMNHTPCCIVGTVSMSLFALSREHMEMSCLLGLCVMLQAARHAQRCNTADDSGLNCLPPPPL